MTAESIIKDIESSVAKYDYDRIEFEYNGKIAYCNIDDLFCSSENPDFIKIQCNPEIIFININSIDKINLLYDDNDLQKKWSN